MALQSAVLGALNDKLLLTPQGESTMLIHFQVIGSGTMTLVLEDSLDGGVTYAPLQIRDMTAIVDASSISAAGIYRSAAFTHFIMPRIRVSAYTSGTFTVIGHISYI